MRSEPNRAEQQNHSEKKLCSDGAGARQRILNGSDVVSSADEDDHGAEGHGDDQQRSQHGEKHMFHGGAGIWAAAKG